MKTIVGEIEAEFITAESQKTTRAVAGRVVEGKTQSLKCLAGNEPLNLGLPSDFELPSPLPERLSKIVVQLGVRSDEWGKDSFYAVGFHATK